MNEDLELVYHFLKSTRYENNQIDISDLVPKCYFISRAIGEVPFFQIDRLEYENDEFNALVTIHFACPSPFINQNNLVYYIRLEIQESEDNCTVRLVGYGFSTGVIAFGARNYEPTLNERMLLRVLSINDDIISK